jgi:hypothetical protein
MKDPKEIATPDMLPTKRGRPVLDPGAGPMSIKERQAKYREGKKVVQFRLTPREKLKIDRYCKSEGISRDELLANWIDENL